MQKKVVYSKWYIYPGKKLNMAKIIRLHSYQCSTHRVRMMYNYEQLQIFEAHNIRGLALSRISRKQFSRIADSAIIF